MYKFSIYPFFLFLVFNFLVINAHGDEQMRLVPPGVYSSELFPCSGCHAGMETNSRKRGLSFHQEIRIEGHGEPRRWCLDCHNPANRDTLRLVNGEEVEFKNLPLFCGQCHGRIYKDWGKGIHGKRTGYWDGPKEYFLCTSCHNPHSPKFKPLAPKPAPMRPEQTLRE
jgi:hypothetical protein